MSSTRSAFSMNIPVTVEQQAHARPIHRFEHRAMACVWELFIAGEEADYAVQVAHAAFERAASGHAITLRRCLSTRVGLHQSVQLSQVWCKSRKELVRDRFVVGGVTPRHLLSVPQQYTEWFGFQLAQIALVLAGKGTGVQ